jgi:4-hydroxyphenylpyruvate dioxygenase
MELRLPAIKGIGGAALYLIDRFEDGKSIYDIDFEWLPGTDRHLQRARLKIVDHLTHNVYRGRMAFWGGFYRRSSTSARSAISTSRANTPASRAAR